MSEVAGRGMGSCHTEMGHDSTWLPGRLSEECVMIDVAIGDEYGHEDPSVAIVACRDGAGYRLRCAHFEPLFPDSISW